jgi:hemoglobin
MSTTPPPLPSEPELHAIARRFYDKVYAHPWLGRFFAGIDQPRQQQKLVRFLLMSWHDPAFGQLQGEYLRDEHAHLYVTAALFELRHELLAQALREHGLPEASAAALLEWNERWRPYVVKASVDECSDAFAGKIVEIPRPA